MSTAPAGPATLFGHPRGLFVLFATEMWERFSYYGMRALLVLYLISYLQFAPSQASTVYKWYTSLVYLTPLLGGFLADKFLGIKRAIIIGGVLMAIGHFLMAFEALPFLYTALGFLILGNGFFKPNISTLVGKMYPAGDARRDGAFSIFYMGINIGAGLAGPVCGALRTNLGWHYGFAAAGIGMVIGLTVFLLGQKTINEAVAAAGTSIAPGGKTDGAPAKAEASDSQPGATGIAGIISTVWPFLLMTLAIVVPALFVYKAISGQEKWINVIMPAAFAIVGGAMGLLLLSIKGASRNKATVVFIFFGVVVLFWMAFEQAGNALNIWAEFNTQRQLGPVKTTAEDFQAFNSIFIVSLAPLFAFGWQWFARKGKEVPSAVKLVLGLIFTSMAFGVMSAAAVAEDATVTRVKLDAVPTEVKLKPASDEQKKGLTGSLSVVGAEVKDDEGKVAFEQVHAGRMLFDETTHELVVRGVLPPFARMDALKPTVDSNYLGSLVLAEKAVKYASEEKPVTVILGPLVPGFVLPKIDQVKDSKPVKVKVTAATKETPLKLELAEDGVDGLEVTFKDGINPLAKASLLGAGAPPAWRATLVSAATESDKARVSGWWLVLQYLLATLAELCISPVGLSLVTKLAPVRFASLFMGVWFLSNSVAQYVGGALGELWGTVPPTGYFVLFIITSAVGAAVMVPLILPVRKLMHEVK